MHVVIVELELAARFAKCIAFRKLREVVFGFCFHCLKLVVIYGLENPVYCYKFYVKFSKNYSILNLYCTDHCIDRKIVSTSCGSRVSTNGIHPVLGGGELDSWKHSAQFLKQKGISHYLLLVCY